MLHLGSMIANVFDYMIAEYDVKCLIAKREMRAICSEIAIAFHDYPMIVEVNCINRILQTRVRTEVVRDPSRPRTHLQQSKRLLTTRKIE